MLSRRYKKVEPGQAMVVYGRDQVRVVTGGAMFVYPILQSVRYLDIGAKKLEFTVGEARTKAGIELDIDVLAVVKFSSQQPKLTRAVEQWMSRPVQDMLDTAVAVLSTHIRAAAAGLEAEQVFGDRDALSSQVRERVGPDLDAMGMDIVALLIREVRDHVGLLDALGRRRAADAKVRGDIAASVAGGIPLSGEKLDPVAVRRVAAGQRLLQQLPDLTEEQVEGLETLLGAGQSRAREVDPSTEGD